MPLAYQARRGAGRGGGEDRAGTAYRDAAAAPPPAGAKALRHPGAAPSRRALDFKEGGKGAGGGAGGGGGRPGEGPVAGPGNGGQEGRRGKLKLRRGSREAAEEPASRQGRPAPPAAAAAPKVYPASDLPPTAMEYRPLAAPQPAALPTSPGLKRVRGAAPGPGPGGADLGSKVERLEQELEARREGAEFLEDRNSQLVEQLAYYREQSAEALQTTELELLGLHDEMLSALKLQDELESKLVTTLAERDAVTKDLETEHEQMASLTQKAALSYSLEDKVAKLTKQVEVLEGERAELQEYKQTAEHLQEVLTETLKEQEQVQIGRDLAVRALQRRVLLKYQGCAEYSRIMSGMMADAEEFARLTLLRRWLRKLSLATYRTKYMEDMACRREAKARKRGFKSWAEQVVLSQAQYERYVSACEGLERMRVKRTFAAWLAAALQGSLQTAVAVEGLQKSWALRTWGSNIALVQKHEAGLVLALEHYLSKLKWNSVVSWVAYFKKCKRKRRNLEIACIYQGAVNRFGRKNVLYRCFVAWTRLQNGGLRGENAVLREANAELEAACEEAKEKLTAVDLENLQLVDRMHELSKELSKTQTAALSQHEELEGLRKEVDTSHAMENSMQTEIASLKAQKANLAEALEQLRAELSTKGEEEALVAMEAQEEAKGNRAQIDQLERELADKELALAALREGNRQTHSDIKQIEGQWLARLEEANRKIADLRRIVDEKEGAYARLEHMHNQQKLLSQEELNQVLAHNSSLQDTLKSSQLQLQELKDQVLRSQKAAQSSQVAAKGVLEHQDERLAEMKKLEYEVKLLAERERQTRLAADVTPGHAYAYGSPRVLSRIPAALPVAPVLRPGSAFNPSPAATFSPVRPPAPVMAQPAPDPHITSLHEEIQHLRTKILQRINEPEG